MDVWDRVRDLRTEIEVSDAALSRARAHLFKTIDLESTGSRKPATRRPLVPIVGVAAGVAVVVTAAVLAVQLQPAEPPAAGEPSTTPTPDPPRTTPPARPTPTPTPTSEPQTAQMVFASVAQRMLLGEAPVPSAGQYLRIDEVSEHLVKHGAEHGVSDLMGRDQVDAAWVASTRSTMYVPSDLHGDWLIGPSDGWDIIGYYGDGAETYAQEWLDSTDPVSDEYFMTGGPIGNWRGGGGSVLADYLDTLPMDADALLEQLSSQPGDTSDPQKVGWALIHLLSFNVGSAELRSVMYEALSRLSGFELTSVDADRATILFHTLPGGASDPISERWQTATIDLRTGVVSEYTDRFAGPSPILPDSVLDERSTFTVSVVDEIP